MRSWFNCYATIWSYRLFLLAALAVGLACGTQNQRPEAATSAVLATPTAIVTLAQPTRPVSLATATAPKASAGATSPALSITPAPKQESRCGQTLLDPRDRQAPTLRLLPGQIAFVCGGQLWTMRPDGSRQKRITAFPTIDWDHVRLFRAPENEPPTAGERRALENAMNSSPRWLADGRIVYASIRDALRLSAASPETERRPFVGATELYTIKPDGTGEWRMSDFNLKPGSYFRRGVGQAECAGTNFCFAGLLSVAPSGTAKTQNLVSTGVVEIRFSECCFYTVVARLSADGTELLPSIDPISGIEPKSIYGVDWSGDDKSVLVTIGAYDNVNRFATDLRLYQADQNRSIAKAGPGQYLALLSGASLAPEGDRAVFCSVSFQPDGNEWSVFLASTGVAEPRRILTLPREQPWVDPPVTVFRNSRECAPRWSPDGNYVVVGTETDELWIVDVHSGVSTAIAVGGQPDWGP